MTSPVAPIALSNSTKESFVYDSNGVTIGFSLASPILDRTQI